ncbi:hypothetical protein SDC9_191847 [bioreactor metagenome]|uniref:Uncharacterized protein n=1 Tax=bioreactor metagenome TaxID=1076179 RepID=A0A645HZ19_9ZZZZ
MSTNLELLPNYTELNNISIFYYITYGLGCDITIDGNLNNYEYILSEANNIRYSNGEIREASLFKEEYNGIKKYRYSYNVGIGWQVGGGEGGGASIEIKYRGSLDPIFENSNFRQHNLFFTFNTSIDFYINFIKGIVSIFKSII